MRYLGRLLVYLAIFFFTLSVSSVLIARVIPVTVTPLKVLRLVENFPDKGLSVQSNWVPLHRINLSMVRAVIATEDNNFLTHRGFDWDAINKALDENREGGRIRGGSTISQQTAKNVFCLPVAYLDAQSSRSLLYLPDRDFLGQAAYHGSLPQW